LFFGDAVKFMDSESREPKAQGYQLIIAEKPTAAEKIAQALADEGKFSRKKIGEVNFFELSRGGRHIVVASTVGHIFSLAEKNKGAWVYPVFDLEWRPSYEVSRSAAFSKKYFYTLKKLAGGADAFVNGCDLDTEGELIFRNILRFIARKEDAPRMRFSTLTKGDLIDAYDNLSPGLDFGLAEAGEARHFLDFLWGVNTSRALTLAIKQTGRGFKILSSGRVQSPTLSLLAEREKEISSFVPKPFWKISALILLAGGVGGTGMGGAIEADHEVERFWSAEEAAKVRERCLGSDAKVKSVVKKSARLQPPAPFNLPALQTAAYEAFGFSPSQTLQIAERLYLAAFISYPRTASEKLPAKIGWRQILAALAQVGDYSAQASSLLGKKKLKAKEGRKTDPAHVAIYPTSSPPKSLDDLRDDERRLYDLIVKRFLAVFGEAAVRETMHIKFDIGGEVFSVSGSRTLKPGWTSLYSPYSKLRETELPKVSDGEVHKVQEIKIDKDETKPPSRYTQGSIITEMERRGLGTKATRAEILQTLYDRNYITGKSIQVTELGMQIVEVLKKYSPELLSERLTRHFESEMDDVLQRRRKQAEVLEDAKKVLSKILAKFKKKESAIGEGLLEAVKVTRREAAKIGVCHSCKSDLRIIKSRKTGKIFVGCSGYAKGCRVSYPLPQSGSVRPTAQSCKICSSPIVFVFAKGKRPWRLCINPKCEGKKIKEKDGEKDTKALESVQSVQSAAAKSDAGAASFTSLTGPA